MASSRAVIALTVLLLGLLVPEKVLAANKVLGEYEQCGGAGGNCAKYGANRVNCKDAPFSGYVCPTNFECMRQTNNKWYWQCVKKTAVTPKPSPSPKPTPTPSPKPTKVLNEYEQCGGAGGDCGLARYGPDQCKDAAFTGWVCPTSFKCERQGGNKWYWQGVKA